MHLRAYRMALDLRNAANVPIAFPTCMNGSLGVALGHGSEGVGASQ